MGVWSGRERPPTRRSHAAQAAGKAVDFLVVGSGIAGLYCALTLASAGADVLVITKSRLTQGNTRFAQGGIAAAFDAQDSPALHLQDTISAGAGLCAEPAARVMVEEGPDFVRDLIALGAHFDRENGEIALAREGAHTQHRVLHARGDATGEEIEEALSRRARTVRVSVDENTFAAELSLDAAGRCVGLVAFGPDGSVRRYQSRATVLATGGAGQIYLSTTNADVVTGDGMAMAFRAGAEIMDMEFIQFHPTALAVEANPRFLVSEAVRGEGAVLVNQDGERFMTRYHPMADLAPRDVVARAIASECERLGTAHVWLDARQLQGGIPARQRFPTIYAHCLEHGIDMERDPVPVAPVAHYCMGGIRTDTWGRTTVPGLLACGETACVGVHGANRLASNSLLESLVFAGRAANIALRCGADDWAPNLVPPGGEWEAVAGLLPCFIASWGHEAVAAGVRRAAETAARPAPDGSAVSHKELLSEVRRVMWRDFGIIRRGGAMLQALRELADVGGRMCAELASMCVHRPGFAAGPGEARNVWSVALLVSLAASGRRESRGAHYREDYPETLPDWRRHTLLRLAGRGVLRAYAPLDNVEV